jgi:hypothetical protein
MVFLRIVIVIITIVFVVFSGFRFVVEVGIVIERAGLDVADEDGPHSPERSQRGFIEHGVVGLEDTFDGMGIETPVVLSSCDRFEKSFFAVGMNESEQCPDVDRSQGFHPKL